MRISSTYVAALVNSTGTPVLLFIVAWYANEYFPLCDILLNYSKLNAHLYSAIWWKFPSQAFGSLVL